MTNLLVIPSGAPITLRAGTDCAVLCLHGYTGYPNDLRFVAETLHREGYTVHVPRLPGHATNAQDFLETNARDWFVCAKNSYLDLCVQYRDVIVLGFSMGGAMAIMLADIFPVDTLILVAPALLVRNRYIALTHILHRFIPRIKNHPVYNGSTQDHRKMYEEYWQWAYLKNVAQFHTIQRKGRKSVKHLTAETLVIVSEADETVPPDVAAYIDAHAHCRSYESLILKKSPHVSLDSCAPERDKVANTITEWLSAVRDDA